MTTVKKVAITVYLTALTLLLILINSFTPDDNKKWQQKSNEFMAKGPDNDQWE